MFFLSFFIVFFYALLVAGVVCAQINLRALFVLILVFHAIRVDVYKGGSLNSFLGSKRCYGHSSKLILGEAVLRSVVGDIERFQPGSGTFKDGNIQPGSGAFEDGNIFDSISISSSINETASRNKTEIRKCVGLCDGFILDFFDQHVDDLVGILSSAGFLRGDAITTVKQHAREVILEHFDQPQPPESKQRAADIIEQTKLFCGYRPLPHSSEAGKSKCLIM